jgi:hypothetical protein
LFRAESLVSCDQQWLSQVREQGGMLLSIDGIQPDQGNEAVDLVREVRTGRMRLSEPTRESETKTVKRLLSPIQALAVPVQGIISDAQTSLLCAIAKLGPKVPHQVCQFHALRDASKIIYEQDRQTKVAVPQKLHPKLRQYRTDLAKRKVSASPAACAQAAVHVDGSAPLRYGGLEMQEALDILHRSLEQIEKKGALPVTPVPNGFTG